MEERDESDSETDERDESVQEDSEPFQSSGSEYQPSLPRSSSENELVELTEGPETNKAPVRKKKRDVSSWKRNVQKLKKARGESYKSMTSDKIVPERKQGSDCKCEKECLKKLSPDEKNEIFTAFNGLADHEKQDSYLSNLVTVTKIKRRRKNVLNANNDNNFQRNYTYKYKVKH